MGKVKQIAIHNTVYTLEGDKTSIVANHAIPNTWRTSGTMNQLISDIDNDETATEGKSYTGTVTLSDLPASMVQAEMKIEISKGSTSGNKIILFTIASENTAPYHWERVSAYGRSGYWREFMPNKSIDNVPTDGSNNLVTSDGVYDAVSAKYTKPVSGIPKTDLAEGVQSLLNKADTAIQEHQSLTSITDLIPSQVTSSNQLADKEFVNSSISTATATFQGTYNSVSDLSLTTSATHAQIATALASEISSPDNNDYCFVQIPTSDSTPTEIAVVERYKFNGTAWDFEYALNNSGYTAAQWAAINSGITSAHVTKLNGIASGAQVNVLEGVQVDGVDLTITNKKVNVDLSGKVDKVAGKQLSTEDYTAAEKTKLSGIETGAQVNDIEHIKIGTTEQTISNKTVSLPASYPASDSNNTELKQDQQFVFRKTNNNWNAKTEVAKRIKGKSLVWNQCVPLFNVLSGNPRWSFENCTSSVSADGSQVDITFTTASNFRFRVYAPNVNGHKYYNGFDYYADSGVTTSSWIGTGLLNGLLAYLGPTEQWTHKGSIKVGGDMDTTMSVTYVGDSSQYNGKTLKIRNFIVVDLTLMFGSGNEPTAEEFEALYPELYYPYNPGELISNDAKSLETVGFNLWDEEWELGSYTNNGAKYPRVDAIRSKNPIPIIDTIQYYNNSALSGVCFYDKGGNFIPNSFVSNVGIGALSIPSKAAFMTFYLAGISTYNNSVCFNVFNSSRNGTYEPYRKSVLPLHLDSFKVKDGQGNITTITGGLKSAGSVYDEIVGNKYIKRIGEVDLGSLNWNKNSDNVFYDNTSTVLSSIHATASEGDVPNLKTGMFLAQTFTEILTLAKEGISFYRAANGIIVYSSSYSSISSTAFKSAMSGVMLYYELATPIEYELVEPIPSVIRSDYDGTEEAVFPVHEDGSPSAPFRADIQYGTNDDDLLDERENETVYGAQVAQKMREVQSFNETIDYKQVSVTGVNDAYRLDRIEGKTLAWNQLVPDAKIDFSNTITDTERAFFDIRLFGKTSASGSITTYYINGQILSTGNYTYLFTTDSTSVELNFKHNGNTTDVHIFEHVPCTPNHKYYLRFNLLGCNPTVAGGLNFKGLHLHDLTLMFGSGNEPATVEEFEAMFPNSYYPYNAGELISNSADGIESVGFNQWDEEWEVGIYSPSSGQPQADTTCIRSKNRTLIFPSSQYYFKGGRFVICWYDADDNFISHSNTGNVGNLLTPPSNARYFRFYMQTYGGGAVYQNDICINLFSSHNGEYEPYMKSTLELNLDKIKVKSPNIWDEEWELGSMNVLNGEEESSTSQIRSKNYIPVESSTTYCLSKGSTSGYISVVWFDKNKNYISWAAFANGALYSSGDSPSNAKYLRFVMPSAYGTTYSNDICINESGWANGRYFPHGVLTLKGGLKSAGSVKDEIKDGKYVRRVGRSALGDGTWSLWNSTTNFYKCSLPSAKAMESGLDQSIISNGMVEHANSAVSGMAIGDYTINATPEIVVHFPATVTTPELAKSYMSGVGIDYILASPETYDLVDEYINIGQFFEDGTMRATYQDETAPNLPIVADVTYGVNTGSIADWMQRAKGTFTVLDNKITTVESQLSGIETLLSAI